MESLQCRIPDIDLARAKALLLSYNRPHQSMDVWEIVYPGITKGWQCFVRADGSGQNRNCKMLNTG